LEQLIGSGFLFFFFSLSLKNKQKPLFVVALHS